MNEPSVSLETIARLADMETDKAMEKVFRKLGFGDDDLAYEERDGERQLLISGKVLDYIKSNKESMRRKLEKASKAAAIKALRTAGEIMELQKTGRKA
jgi:hypothetical protein